MGQDPMCSTGPLCSALLLSSQGPVTSCSREGQTPGPTVESLESPTSPCLASGPKSLSCWPPAPRGPAGKVRWASQALEMGGPSEGAWLGRGPAGGWEAMCPLPGAGRREEPLAHGGAGGGDPAGSAALGLGRGLFRSQGAGAGPGRPQVLAVTSSLSGSSGPARCVKLLLLFGLKR